MRHSEENQDVIERIINDRLHKDFMILIYYRS